MAVKRRGPQPNTPDDNTPTNQNGKVSFDIPQDVSVNEPFEIAIHLKGFEANQTLENLRVGIYKEGGQQIGQFSNGNGAFSLQDTVRCQQLKLMKMEMLQSKLMQKYLKILRGQRFV